MQNPFVDTLFQIPAHDSVTVVTISTAILCAILLRAIYVFRIYPYFVSPLRHLPSPNDHHFLIGQALNQIRSGSPNEPYISWAKRWPEAEMVRYFSFLNTETILVTGLDALRHVLSAKPYSFVKPPFYVKLLMPLVGKGLFFSEGEEHKHQRRLMGVPFSVTKLKLLCPVFQKKAEELSAYFDRQIETKGGVVEAVSTFTSLTLDIIGIAALGVELHNLEEPSRFHECYQQVFDPPAVGQALFVLDAIFPIRWMPIEANRQFRRATKELRGLVRDIVRQRVKDVTEGRKGISDTGRQDILTYMIEQTYTTEDPWEEEELMGHILNMLSAGHETSASGLQWATYALVKHPAVQDRLRAEVAEMLKQTPTPGYYEIESLQYLNSFCKEVLRVWCPSNLSYRYTAEDIVVSGVLVPKGTTITLMPSVIHHNPGIWGDDADEFKPERWDQDGRDPHAFAPFLQGPRQCIGRAFAMLEFKIIMVEMVRKFLFEDAQADQELVLVNPSNILLPKSAFVKVSRLE
ncbi:cytochrome p450 monooxygenase [Lasiosphaeris hirsuta]|uniref:Cytochrome p450 monooxygenase n=1 Tax=Lasiosphaeris hirsuta TaxID=260670 RepID=A0AA40DKN2_9PEZI|nr:cytochrome p450 monooxygenase [Lasiosphaeris hirsuta]